ncbi:MAG: hypothetical protein LW713_10155, partial [Acetobacteraceae bacterium]|nr:hypothetical protein [Acetobacteraceae bacterium]
HPALASFKLGQALRRPFARITSTGLGAVEGGEGAVCGTAYPLKNWRTRYDSNVRPLPSEGKDKGLRRFALVFSYPINP